MYYSVDTLNKKLGYPARLIISIYFIINRNCQNCKKRKEQMKIWDDETNVLMLFYDDDYISCKCLIVVPVCVYAIIPVT